MDQRQLRSLLGHFATGVAIVTARAPSGEPAGVTINSFNSVSLSPALVMFSLTRGLWSLPVFEETDHFGISFLSRDQQDLSNRFAARGVDKWQGATVLTGRNGVPLVKGALAHIECRKDQMIEAGDHIIFLCAVTGMEAGPPGEPLVFFRGGYRALSENAVSGSN